MTPLPGKGGSSLAQAFLSNTATQPTAVPAITQPVQQGLPSMGSLAPMTGAGGQQQELKFGPVPPSFKQPEFIKKAYGDDVWQSPDGWLYNTTKKTWSPNAWVQGSGEYVPPSQYQPDVRMWEGLTGALQSQMGGGLLQSAQPSGQMSQAQLLARAMNQAALQGR